MIDLFSTLGGLGIFLLGVTIMTDGLKGVAGDALRDALTRFTKSPSSGAATGAISTAILQSSSATTVAAVGFVSAGLLTYPQALGVIFGANVGTTITGWLVALLGFKLKLGHVVLPVILAGVLLNLFARGRWKPVGMALAGFGLVFVGIDALQAGMSSLQGTITPDSFPANTWLGRLQLLLMGIAITLVTQSSSAGVAAALAAVYTGTINFEQAAAMVIGMDVGTTATALMATVGGSADTRRTGYSHVVYNLLTGIGAFALLSPYVRVWQSLSPGLLQHQAEIALVGFHTSFNLIGLLVILPLTQRFARLMFKLVPVPQDPLADRLDKTLLKEPYVALETAHALQVEQYAQQAQQLLYLMRGQKDKIMLFRLDRSLAATEQYLDLIRSDSKRTREWAYLLACFHVQDHMNRLQHRLHTALNETRDADDMNYLPLPQQGSFDTLLAQIIERPFDQQTVEQAQRLSNQLREQQMDLREHVMNRVAGGELDTGQGDMILDALRWFTRISHHLYRISHHLNIARALAQQSTITAEVRPVHAEKSRRVESESVRSARK